MRDGVTTAGVVWQVSAALHAGGREAHAAQCSKLGTNDGAGAD